MNIDTKEIENMKLSHLKILKQQLELNKHTEKFEQLKKIIEVNIQMKTTNRGI